MNYRNRLPIRLLCATALCLGAPGNAQTKSPPAVPDLLIAAASDAEAGNCSESLTSLNALVASHAFSGLPDEVKIAAYDLGVGCAMDLNRQDAAYRYSVEGTAFADPTPTLLKTRLWFEIVRHNPRQAMVFLERLAELDRATLYSLPIQVFFQLNAELEAASENAARLRLLSVIADPAYTPTEPGFRPDAFRRDYAELLIDAGTEAEARQAISQITDASMLVRISLDPRLRHMLPASFDARAAVETDLAVLRQMSAKHPDSVNVLIEMSKRLNALGRSEEALDLLRAASPDGDGASKFTDLNRNQNWWWNAMARSLGLLGRYEEAVDAFRRGANIDEGGGMNVNQALNFGAFQLHFGRGAAALSAIEAIDFQSGILNARGMMVAHLVRGCARYLVGDKAGAEADRTYALAHEADAPSQLTDLLLCMGDVEGAAAVVIRRLDNPEQRADALFYLSDFEPPLHRVETDPTDKALEQLKERPDVRAAIERAGGIRRFRIQRI